MDNLKLLNNVRKIDGIELNMNKHTEDIKDLSSQMDTIMNNINDISINVNFLGVDKTGVVSCENEIKNALLNCNTLLFPNGVYRLSDTTFDFSKPIKIIGGIDTTIIVGRINFFDNVYCENIKFLRENSYSTTERLINVNNTTTNIKQASFVNCNFEFDKTEAGNYFGINVENTDNLLIKNCNFINCIINSSSEGVFKIIDNKIDGGNLIVDHEGLHCTSGSGEIIGNHIINCNLNAVDFYPVAHDVVFENNVIENCGMAFEIKTIFEDGDSIDKNLRNITIQNNVFNNVGYTEIRTFDRRTSKIANDKERYSKNITIKNNTWNYTDVTGDITTFRICGNEGIYITDNTFNLKNVSGSVTIFSIVSNGSNIQETMNLKIEGNNVCSTKGYVFISCTTPVNNFIIKDNTLSCSSTTEGLRFLTCSGTYILDTIIDNNLIDEVKAGSTLSIGVTNENSKLTIKNQTLKTCYFLSTSGKFSEINLINCKQEATIDFSNNIGLLKIDKLYVENKQIEIQSSCNIETLIIINSIFNKMNNYAIRKRGNVNNYSSYGNSFIKTSGASSSLTSAWETGNGKPIATDYSSFFN